MIAILDEIKNEKKIDEGESDDQDEPSDLPPRMTVIGRRMTLMMKASFR